MDQTRLRTALDADAPSTGGRLEGTPGKTTLSDGLVVQRKATDNGVLAGAEQAVEAASGSSGQPLPVELQRKFESSLGADLSGVRVHTGSESGAASQSLSARAYTVGNDIHFNQGQYDPHSERGQHLIAHEVVHTVQQSGVARRLQLKELDVSHPHDHAELEADAAAKAMVDGQPASVSQGSGVARKIMRDEERKNSYTDPGSLGQRGGKEGAAKEEAAEMKDSVVKNKKVAAVKAAADFVSVCTGFEVDIGGKEVMDQMAKSMQSEVQTRMTMTEGRIEVLKRNISWCEGKIGPVDELVSKVVDTINAKRQLPGYQADLANSEKELEKLQIKKDGVLGAAAQKVGQLNGTVAGIAGFLKKAAAMASAASDKISPDAFESAEEATAKIDKLVNALSIASSIADTSALNKFKQKPSLETAEAWAEHISGTIAKLQPLAAGLPMGFDVVFAGLFAMPGVISKTFVSIMKARYDKIDQETAVPQGKLLEEGTSG